jgi:TPR repeat protein
MVWIARTLGLIPIIIFLTSCAETDGISDYRRGIAVYESGDWEGAKVHFQEAFRKFLPLAERGEGEFQYYVALIYARYLGLNHRISRPEAAKWMRRAAEQQFAPAQLELGRMYKNGEGVPEDLSEAHRWYIRAAESGGENYQLFLGASYFAGSDSYGISIDDTQALKWLRRASEKGTPAAFFLLGAMVDAGRGIARDLLKAIRLYETAAHEGVAEAQASLGHIYFVGDGVPRNCEKSVKLFLEAARRNLGNAQFALARMYQSGECVPTNNVQAFLWYSNAWHNYIGCSWISGVSLRIRSVLERRMSRMEIHEADALWRQWSPIGAPSLGFRFAVPRPSCDWLKQLGGRLAEMP